ncbi:MAG: FxsA family protein [Planctomycetes bacterium]|nr:FxsA family protein [Planctomycetota bacterium]
MGRLLLLFIVVPAVELSLLIEIGKRIGTMRTLALIVITGIVGASLAKWQGLNVLKRLREESAQGILPAESLLDGVFILVAGALLITPGVLTDIFGFLCLIPAFRRILKRYLWTRIKRSIEKGRMQVTVHVDDYVTRPPDRQSHDNPNVIDVE